MTKKSFLTFITLLFVLFCPFLHALDENSFKASGWISDFAGIIDSATTDKLNGLIAEIEKKTGAEIAVVTIKSLDGDSLEDFTNRLFNKWGVGKKGKDNGVMVLVSLDDRKIRIEVGYGLEEVIPDGLAGTIIREEMTPRFRQGSYGDGIFAGVYAVSAHIAEFYKSTLDTEQPPQVTYNAVGTYRKASPLEMALGIIFMIVMAIIFIKNPWLFILLFMSGRGGGRYGGGGGFGGGFGGFGGGGSGGGGASGGW
jgi:uncharacterized protein